MSSGNLGHSSPAGFACGAAVGLHRSYHISQSNKITFVVYDCSTGSVQEYRYTLNVEIFKCV